MAFSFKQIAASLQNSLVEHLVGGNRPPLSSNDYALLEQRVLFSAAPLDALDFDFEPEPVSELDPFSDDYLLGMEQDELINSVSFGDPLGFIDPSSQAELPADSELELIVIDANVDNAEVLAADLLAGKDGAVEILWLDANRDGIEQIAEAVAGKSYSAMHVVSHGSGGEISLGNGILNRDTLFGYARQIARWGTALSEDADILFYGCDLAATESGQALIKSIASLCDCDVAASDDLTGHADLGGDWDLEYVVGDIETSQVF